MTKTQVSVAEVKQHLADLLGRVAYGKERVTITRRGKPMAMLIPVGEVKLRHLADAQGWLDEHDPTQAAIGTGPIHSHAAAATRGACAGL